MSDKTQGSAMNEKSATIRDALNGLDDTLAGQDQSFDVAAGLAGLMNRIDQRESDPFVRADQLVRANRAAEIAVDPPSRAVLDLTHARVVGRQRESVVGMVAITGMAALMGVLITMSSLTWIGTVSLVALAIAVAGCVAFILRSSASFERSLIEFAQEYRQGNDERPRRRKDRDATTEDAPGPATAKERRVHSPTGSARGMTVIENFEGQIHIDGYQGQSRRPIAMARFWPWAALTISFLGASWSATQGMLEPLHALTKVLAYAAPIPVVIIFLISMIREDCRRASALNTLKTILGHRTANEEAPTLEGEKLEIDRRVRRSKS
ncbi:hypothetical protein [Lentzea sp. CA-135723]|uniref:hypothetical protein n=1 Tax=Lentzea sp. CA-135723 TaxID=3239950 RepID=UPI003D8CF8B0